MKEIEKVAVEVFSQKKTAQKILAKYDMPDDVLYVNFLNSNAQKADFGTRLGDYIFRLKRNVIVGVTILNAMEHFRRRFEDMPSIILFV